MADKGFYIQGYTRNANGVFVVDGVRYSVEKDFGYCRYKSMSGLNSRGKQKGLYVETYAESESARVWFADVARREQTTVTLSLCFFGCNPSLSTGLSEEEQIKAASDNYHRFCDSIENKLLLWYDDYRQRKALFYLSEPIEPSTDAIKGIPYLLCSFKLTNVFGRTYSGDSTSIEDWLANGGKEVSL